MAVAEDGSGTCAVGASTATISEQKGLAVSQAFLEMVAGAHFEEYWKEGALVFEAVELGR